MTEQMTRENWEKWLNEHPQEAAEMESMLNQREAYENLARAFPNTYSLFERADEGLVNKLVECLRKHEVEIVYPGLVAHLDNQTTRELGQLLELLKAKPQ